MEHRAEVAVLLLLGPVGDDRRPEHPDADRIEHPGQACARELLVDDDLLDGAETLAAGLQGPGDTREPGLGKAPLPGAARGEVDLLVVAWHRRLRRVLLKPPAHLLAVPGLLRSVVQVHPCAPFG